ncbi:MULTISPECIES: type I-C CRISPR-associated protein Cas7/Csd2 [unclassified Methanoculleus]|jgi:CRISPR-associated protein Csd2|uniref:Type I-C CRISPR-associated protein Cas7/Csd2 n=1 Tax=Methanoculleus palmolei TaxID=72612 RepID=A0ABD8A980_9EURY|nr:type I-C CRISPR-associated protein Cas7/Csd2 [Methanoculleus sp. UBA377]MDD2472423.1 type I-C CRISPR-associated protein Cas7/Csd2 [Methanoculleus sp.]WOX56076.1 type I-C CRISPR-associated protein Cas7/Csd2 [Methanoculleus palmolei]
MTNLENKIDFAVVVSVKNANPNGDPLNGNRPRENYDGCGEISDVCLKRKIRNRMQDMEQPVFVKSDDRSDDGFKSLRERADACKPLADAIKKKDVEKAKEIACGEWLDVRSFGQLFAFKGDDASIGIRGPVSIHPAFSVDAVDVTALQITKSVNSVPGAKKASDTMGMKYRVDFGVYVFYGSINCQLAEKTGFSPEDAEIIRKSLTTLFENDCSSARPEGSMEVCKVFWWKHNSRSGQYSSAKVHRTLHVRPKTDTPKSSEDYEITVDPLEGLEPEIYEGA